jgi:hypothetical protein
MTAQYQKEIDELWLFFHELGVPEEEIDNSDK